MITNPYQVLGVSEGASMDEIKRAYRKKAKEYHPDLHPDDPRATEKMQQINEAYDMLCNPDKYRNRRQAGPNPGYGSAGQQGWQNGYGPGWYGQGWQDPFERYGQSSGQSNWRFYTRDGGWQSWNGANSPQGDPNARRNAPMVSPLLSVFRIIIGLMVFLFMIRLFPFALFFFF